MTQRQQEKNTSQKHQYQKTTIIVTEKKEDKMQMSLCESKMSASSRVTMVHDTTCEAFQTERCKTRKLFRPELREC